MTYTRITRYGLAGLVIASAFAINAAIVNAQAQDSDTKAPSVKHASDGGRDPFTKYRPPRVAPRKSNGQVTPPSIQERIAQYKAQKLAAMNARMPAPKPTTALLLSEMQIVGISHTPRGYAAIVEATPIKLSYVIYPGERFYDGQLVAIDDNRLVFRRETVFTDGRRERSVETKALRQSNSADAMTAVKAAPAGPAVDEPEKQKVSAADKP